MNITERDIGRKVITRSGDVGKIVSYIEILMYPVRVYFKELDCYGLYSPSGKFSDFYYTRSMDLKEFVDEEQGEEMDYEPFDLERALAGEPVILRDGRKAYVRHQESELNAGGLGQLVGYVETDKPTMAVLSWRMDGLSACTLSSIVGMYPQYKLIHGVKVPAFPYLEPKEKEVYYAASIIDEDFYNSVFWDGSKYVKTLWERGLIYPFTEKGKQAAILHAKVLLGLVGKGCDCKMSIVKEYSGTYLAKYRQEGEWKEWRTINKPECVSEVDSLNTNKKED